jgi:predicted DNA binding CopG/RHH family protein
MGNTVYYTILSVTINQNTLDVKENILLSPLSDLDKGDNKKKLFFTFGYKEKYYYLPYQTWIREVIK